MYRPTNILFSLSVISLLWINPVACAKACKQMAKNSDAAADARYADDVVQHADDTRHTQEPPPASTSSANTSSTPGGTAADQFTHESASTGSAFRSNDDNTFTYRNTRYNQFDEIPFHATDQLYMERRLTPDEARHLMNRGVKFVYNNPAYLLQRAKKFKIIYLISEDVEQVKSLYGLDDEYAKKLIDHSAAILSNENILKAASVDEMILRQDEILEQRQVPILVFHNDENNIRLTQFDKRSNMITCNSFKVNADAYLVSTDLLDINAVLDGLQEGYARADLQSFYAGFTNAYHAHLLEHHQQRSLIYISGGAVGGVSAVAYAYYDNKE